MKIAIQMDSDRNIIGILQTDDSTAERQSKFDGWTLVESDPTFLISDKELWTIRESDNVLVHVSTGQTPDEENKTTLTELTKMQLAGQLTYGQLQSAVTVLTKQMAQDKITYQAAITALTKELAQQKIDSSASNTK